MTKCYRTQGQGHLSGVIAQSYCLLVVEPATISECENRKNELPSLASLCNRSVELNQSISQMCATQVMGCNSSHGMQI